MKLIEPKHLFFPNSWAKKAIEFRNRIKFRIEKILIFINITNNLYF